MIGRIKALLAGFALGIFLAPRSGRASRALLREKIEELLDLGDERLEAMESEMAARRREGPERGPDVDEGAPIPADPLDEPFEDPLDEPFEGAAPGEPADDEEDPFGDEPIR